MTTEHEMAVAIATEIGKQVPVKQVYEDTTSPAARQIGATIEDLVKVVRLVGFPIQWLAVQQDRFRYFIERAKDRVPEEQRILPAPQILGPILEGIRYEVEDTSVVEMFENLLSRAMDAKRKTEAHPSFPHIIRQLSPSQAKTIDHLNRNTVITVYQIYGDGPIKDKELAPSERHLPVAGEDLDFHFEHLIQLGIVELGQVLDWSEMNPGDGVGNYRYPYNLTLVGRTFAKACLPDH